MAIAGLIRPRTVAESSLYPGAGKLPLASMVVSVMPANATLRSRWRGAGQGPHNWVSHHTICTKSLPNRVLPAPSCRLAGMKHYAERLFSIDDAVPISVWNPIN
jgi:hypothetical protein